MWQSLCALREGWADGWSDQSTMNLISAAILWSKMKRNCVFETAMSRKWRYVILLTKEGKEMTMEHVARKSSVCKWLRSENVLWSWDLSEAIFVLLSKFKWAQIKKALQLLCQKFQTFRALVSYFSSKFVKVWFLLLE